MTYVLACGSMSGIVTWASSFPFDIIKTEMQVDNLSTPKYNLMREAAKSIYENHGISGFYRGLSPCLLRALPVNAAIFGGFEFMMKHLAVY